MTSVGEDRSRADARRRYDARATRCALLDAATALFGERGYDGTTVRDIGERAGVDPALIARYFGGKEGLYLATLDEESRPPLPRDPVAALELMLAHADEHGTGPVALAMVSPTSTDAARDHSVEVIRTRVVEPLAAELADRGVPEARLRAEVLVALAMGVSLTRANGTLAGIADAPLDRLLAVLAPLAEALQQRGG
jgi:AcrR family transcriptional regulator